jgi:hypothetical protein
MKWNEKSKWKTKEEKVNNEGKQVKLKTEEKEKLKQRSKNEAQNGKQERNRAQKKLRSKGETHHPKKTCVNVLVLF